MRYGLLRILLVDDNRHMRVLLGEILRAVGIVEIFEARDGGQGLEVLAREPVDIVMTDLSMQPMDGIDFVRRLRTEGEGDNRRVPVIMVTGHATMARVNEARDAGVDEFLVKPFAARTVLERLHQIIDHPRPYVESPGYSGPERRRRRMEAYAGPRRRASDRDPCR